jgi:hypothetical protein
LLKQANVFDGDHSLSGKVLQYGDLSGGKRLNFLAIDCHRAA